MALYLRTYDNHNQYETCKIEKPIALPNVSYCNEFKDAHFDRIVNYKNQPLTIIALGSGTLSFIIPQNITTVLISEIGYSKNDENTIHYTPNINNQEMQIDVNVNYGDKVYWYGPPARNEQGYSNTSMGYAIKDNYIGSYFRTTVPFNVEGNIYSLIIASTFQNLNYNNYTGSGTFCKLFNGCPVINAKNLILPNTTVYDGYYYQMFQDCDSLITPPKLPATLLGTNCYAYMFYHCNSLKTAPTLPAIILAEGCYMYMFYRCNSLIKAPELPALNLSTNCYNGMFIDCSSLCYLNARFTDSSLPKGAVTGWLDGTGNREHPENCLFIKNNRAEWRNDDIIPIGWTVVERD